VFQDSCSLAATIDSLSDYMLENKQKIEDGFLPRLANVEDIKTKTQISSEIESNVKNMCSETDVAQKQVVGNILCKSGKFKLPLLQKFTGKTACLVNDVIKRAEQWQVEQDQTANRYIGGFDFLQGMGRLYLVGLVLFVILVIALLVFLTTDSGQQVIKTAGTAAVLV